MSLPFLVVYGAWIWKIALVGLVAASLKLSSRRLHNERRAVKTELELIVAGLQNANAGSKRLVGRLKSGTAATAYRVASDIDASSEVVIESDGVDIRIERPKVVQGSRVRHTKRFRVGETLTRTLSIGDQVIAVGAVTQSAPTDYRGRGEFVMHSAELFATRPDVRVFSPPLRKSLLYVAAWTGFWLLGMYWVGLNAKAASHVSSYRNGELPAFGSSEIAAALPFSRKAALDDLYKQVRHDGERITNRREYELAIQLAKLRGRCGSHVADSFDPDREIAEAMHCARNDLVEAYIHAGRFDDAAAASDEHTSPERLGEIAIARGDWKGAATAARSMVQRVSDEEVRDRWACIATVMDAFAGAPIDRLVLQRRHCEVAAEIVGEPTGSEPSSGARQTIALIRGAGEDTWSGLAVWLSRSDAGRTVHVEERASLYLMRGDFDRARDILRANHLNEYTVALHAGAVGSDQPDECAGDGVALADRLRNVDDGRNLTTAFEAVPRIRTHRDAMLDALPFVDDTSGSEGPFGHAKFAATRRDLARLAGDPIDALRWQLMFARFDNVLADRRKVLGFQLWYYWD